jgi:hypothetical protein
MKDTRTLRSLLAAGVCASALTALPSMRLAAAVVWSSPSMCIATAGPSALAFVMEIGHNISPRLGKQLVLELHIRVESLEVV